MNIAVVGLGKLGLPVAAAIASKGHTVTGTDANPEVCDYIRMANTPYKEEGLNDLLDRVWIDWQPTVRDAVKDADIVFVAVQTPHDPNYEGVTPAPDRKRDFEYGYLAQAYRDVTNTCRPDAVVAVISTVLPGTMRRSILPQSTHALTVYNPFFIAMGTTIADFTQPEFVILGSDDDEAAERVGAFYRTIHDRPVVRTSIDSAELVKVAYNGVISAKIVLGNWIGEICDKTAADADEVHWALSHATERLWSPRYFAAGMGDGGGCHPRDNIALSWLAERLDLSVDVGGWVTEARERHCLWLAQTVADWHTLTGLPVGVCGLEYKPETDLRTGSPARLLLGMLEDLYPVEVTGPPPVAGVFFIGCRHQRYTEWEWPAGSVVIDPFGYIPDRPGVVVKRIGRK